MPAAYGDGMSYNTMPPPSSPPGVPRTGSLGFPLFALVGLAAMGLPRAILHDLHLIQQGSGLNWLLALGPVALWILLAVIRRVRNPFLTVLVIGAIFGVMLAVTHQLLWDIAYHGDPPSIGSGVVGTVFPRIAAVWSGIFTGAMIGAIGGLIAWGIQMITGRGRA